jgi:hypothetical protein
MNRRAFLTGALFLPALVSAQRRGGPRLVRIGTGWARNQINAVIFRRHALTSHGGSQYASFYDAAGRVVLAKRSLESTRWTLQPTSLTGDLRDAHNAICIAVDGHGFLHVAWNHHTSPLQYCRGLKPGSLELSQPMPMTGDRESRVTYPEFQSLPGGDLLFLYRDGVAGDGRLVINRYAIAERKWTRVQDGLLSGEGRRSAYWQATVDSGGAIHLSWVWRETADVRTNHDLAYAVSRDGGRSWTTSSGEACRLPITAESADYAARIPEGSDLINQTSMCVDHHRRPLIASYWRPSSGSAPQCHVVRHDGRSWKTLQVTQRTTRFSLGGFGTQRIPLSRPMILSATAGDRTRLFLIYRDEERGSRVTLAQTGDLESNRWSFQDLTEGSVDYWEPSCDLARWQGSQQLHLFLQRVGQGAHESLDVLPPQPIYVLEFDPFATGVARPG